MAFQICDLEPTDLGAAIRLLEEIRQLPDSTPIEIDQFITAVERTSPSVTREMYDTFRSEVATFERI